LCNQFLRELIIKITGTQEFSPKISFYPKIIIGSLAEYDKEEVGDGERF
jgi:hypothetical protein